MNVTASSTTADDAWRQRYLPPDLLCRTDALLDELVELRAEVQRLQPNPAKQPDPAAQARAKNANAAKVSRLDTAIEAAIEHHRLQLARHKGSRTSKAVWLHDQIDMTLKLAKTGGEVPAGYELFKRPPGWRTIYNKLNKLSL